MSQFMFIDPYLVAIQGVRYGAPSYTTATLGWLSFDLVIDAPLAFDSPDEPLVIHYQNTYDGIELHLTPEWSQFIRRAGASVYFLAKKYSSLEDEYFRVKGRLDEANDMLLFDLTVTETSNLPHGWEVYWEMSVAKGLAPEFFRVLINGRLQVAPTLRRVANG